MRVHHDQQKGPAEVPGPVRTCVGCRRRDSDSRLLRIVHDPRASALSPDPDRRAVGRGAWVHRDAERRQVLAFAHVVPGLEGGTR